MGRLGSMWSIAGAGVLAGPPFLLVLLQPDLADAHYNAARLHEQLGDAKNAVRHFSAYRRLERRR